MQILPDFPGNESDGYIGSQDDDATDIAESPGNGFAIETGWDAKLTKLDIFSKDKNIDYKLIKLANERLSLHSVLKKYNIHIKNTQVTASGWLPPICCPFKDHKDKTPSFGFNPEQNIFNCFGCHRSGKGVQFISFMDGRNQFEVSKEILGDTSSIEEILEEVDGQNQEKITQLLVEYGAFVRAFVSDHQDDLKAEEYIDAVTWSLDVYLRKHTLVGSIDLKCLEMIIKKIKQQIELFGE